MKRLMVFILLLLTLMMACATPAIPTHTPTRLETIDIGAYSGIKTREQLVIESQADWKELWSMHVSIFIPAPELPEVDFSQEMVIAVFSGEKLTGGYFTEIVEIVLMNDEVTAFFQETSPKPEEPVTEALTQPFHIVKIKRIDDLPVVFVRREQAASSQSKVQPLFTNDTLGSTL